MVLASLVNLFLFAFQSLAQSWSRLMIRVNDLFLRAGKDRTQDFFHKVVLIGDGYAKGFGERVMLGYPSGASRAIMGSVLTNFPQIRHQWEFISRGVLGATSEEWKPEGELLEKTMSSKPCADGEVVVVMVGTQDVIKQREQLSSEKEASELEGRIVSNIMDIANELRRRGKMVCICDIPTMLPLLKPHADLVNRINKAIAQAAESAPGGAIPVARMSSGRVSRGAMNLSWDGIHLSYRGYNNLGEEIMANLSNTLVQVEWTVHQRYLSRRRQDVKDDEKTPPLTPEHVKKSQ